MKLKHQCERSEGVETHLLHLLCILRLKMDLMCNIQAKLPENIYSLICESFIQQQNVSMRLLNKNDMKS